MTAVKIIISADAGPGDNTKAAERLADIFKEDQIDTDISLARNGAEVIELARKAASEPYNVIVAAGGDGTVNSVASAVIESDKILGVLPLGTLNHFAKDVGVPLDLDDAIRAVAAGRLIRVDVADVNGRPFINNASVGMYASLIAERQAMQRLGRRKWFAHGLAAARVWRRYHRLHVLLGADGRERAVRTPFVFIGNNEYQLSGLELGGRTKLDAGRLHVCMAPGMPRHRVARMILVAIFGDVCELEGFEAFTASEVTLDGGTPRLRVSLDGEVITLENPLTFRVRPRVLPVIIP